MMKHCKKVLKELRKLSCNSDTEITFLGESTSFCLSNSYQTTYDYSKYQKEISSILNQLNNDGYIVFHSNPNDFSLTARGLHPFRFQWEIIKLFLIKSIIVPIIVSIITSLIVILLKGE